MRYKGNNLDEAGPFYCSECGRTQTPIDICRYCRGRTNASLMFPTRTKLGRDGRRGGAFYESPSKREVERQEAPEETVE